MSDAQGVEATGAGAAEAEPAERRAPERRAPERRATDRRATWKAGMSTTGTPPAGGGAVYGLGMIGALVYFLGTAETRWDYVLAFGKALVWPALLVHRAFRVLGG
jgi:uncharacterized membrane protein